MTTQTINTFETLDLEALANVEGGNRCKDLIFGGALTGAGAGFTRWYGSIWCYSIFQELL
ncbi:MAG: Blp family class II bacteriocin [Streptococcus sp.]